MVLPESAATGMLELVRNVGQAADSEGHVYCLMDQSRLDTKVQHKQCEKARKRRGSTQHRLIGGQLTKLTRRQNRIRSNDTHHISRALADQAHTVVPEELNTQSMTQIA